jgi:hypothetical protein
MFKAQHQPSGQEIIILDTRWKQQIDYLREMDKKDALVCPGCKQPVRVRAGKVKRWHFAHKHLHNCPFERESPKLLMTRAVLYEWLVEKFGEDYVTVEKTIDSTAPPRHIDCWVEKEGQTFAYWIFDRRMPPDERSQLATNFARLGVPVNRVFVAELLRMEQDLMQDRLHLTTTERTFIQKSEFDAAWQTHFEHLGGSLHYLDADSGILTSFRNLSIVHKPQLYGGKRLEHCLNDVSASSTTGEFVHPGEEVQRKKRQREIEQQKWQAEERLQKAKDFFRGESKSKTSPLRIEQPIPNQQPFERFGTCKFCGKETTDWITYFGPTKECICRDCKDKA